MFSQESLLKLIDLVYAAACDPSKWQPFLNALCATMGAAGADIVAYDRDKPAISVQVGVGIVGPEFQRDYHAYEGCDPYLAAGNAAGFFRTGAIGLGERFLPTTKFKETQFYNDFAKRYDYVGGLVGIMAEARARGSAIAVSRPPKRASERRKSPSSVY